MGTDEGVSSEGFQERIFYREQEADIAVPLADKCAQLHNQQYRSWELLRRNYDGLHSVRTRRVICDGYDVTLQFNPARIGSTTAKTDEQSLHARPCFLCLQNLPREQKGIILREPVIILCNPFPIFPYHYTIGSVVHVPQALASNVTLLLGLARRFDSRLTLFYNGPRCGASAPHHFHFQACPPEILPVERLAGDDERRETVIDDGEAVLILLRNIGRSCLLVEGTDEPAVGRVIMKVVAALQEAGDDADEPMVNIITHCSSGRWRVFIFPRSRHRPEAYFADEPAKIVVSPASVDMGGLIITPREKDFTGIRKEQIGRIFGEVSIPEDQTRAVIDSVRRMLHD